MSFESVLRKNLIPNDLLKNPYNIKVIAQAEFERVTENAMPLSRTVTPCPAKNIVEVMELIRQAITDYEERTRVIEDAKIRITYEKPDVDQDLETVSLFLSSRNPGMFSQGRPGEGKTKNLKPVLREIVDDPDSPGYKRAILGYYYDNILRITCWARTAKQANLRSLWIEDVMEEYTWFFIHSGVNRFLYNGRQNEIVHEVKGNKYYGRPIDYFVRTEKLRNVSQKILEEICINMTTRVNRI